jgi:flagellar hook-length control protein FliK
MNPSLLAVDIVVSGAPGVSVCPVSSGSAATRNVKQSLIASSDSPFLSGSSQPTQFDKALAVAELHSSDDALSREGPLAVSQENQDEPELVTEDCPFLAVQATDLVQFAAPVASPAAPVFAFAERTGGEGEAAIIDNPSPPQGELQPQNNPAPLISMPPDSGLSLVTIPSPAPGLNVAEPLDAVSLAAESEDKPFSTLLNQSLTGAVTTGAEQAISRNTEESPALDKTLTVQSPLPIGENSTKAGGMDITLVSAPDEIAVSDGQKIPQLDPPAPLASGHAQTVSANPEESAFAAKKPIDNKLDAALVSANTERTPAPPALASQEAAGAVSNGQKIPQLDPLVPPVLGYAQTVSANPEEVGVAAKKPIDNKTAAGNKIRTLFESVEDGGKKSANNLSSDSASQKLNVVEIQVSAHQAKDLNASVSEVNPNLQQILSDNNAQILSQRSSTSQVGNTADTAYQGDLSLNIRKQILESIQSSLSGGDRQISIRLNPPELGKVFMRFQEHDAQITGLLEVSQSQTRYQIEQALPQIIRDLQDSGVQIKRLEVVLTEQTDYHASQDQSLLNSWSQQNSSAESGTTGGNGSADVRLTNNDGYQDSLLRQAQITDGSINILA